MMKTTHTDDAVIYRMASAAAALTRGYIDGFTSKDRKDVRGIIRRTEKLYAMVGNEKSVTECYAQAFAEFFEKVLTNEAEK